MQSKDNHYPEISQKNLCRGSYSMDRGCILFYFTIIIIFAGGSSCRSSSCIFCIYGYVCL